MYCTTLPAMTGFSVGSLGSMRPNTKRTVPTRNSKGYTAQPIPIVARWGRDRVEALIVVKPETVVPRKVTGLVTYTTRSVRMIKPHLLRGDPSTQK